MAQLDTAVGAKDVFIGNLLVADHDDIVLTLTDTRPAKAAFVAHNRTDDTIDCTVRPRPGFSLLGASEIPINVAPGTSLCVPIQR